MNKEDKIVEMAYDDTIGFLLNNKKTDKWKGKNGSFIAYGLLNAVFEVLFNLAPSKVDAMEIIQMSLCNFIDEENLEEEITQRDIDGFNADPKD